jgi:hypothetical protein
VRGGEDNLIDLFLSVQAYMWVANDPPTATNGSATSNIRLAVDAFRHVADRFENLQAMMAEFHIQPQDFMVDVGFIDGHVERTQGVYLYCQKQLEGRLSSELVKLFHPFPYEVLPFPETTDDVLDNNSYHGGDNGSSGSAGSGTISLVSGALSDCSGGSPSSGGGSPGSGGGSPGSNGGSPSSNGGPPGSNGGPPGSNGGPPGGIGGSPGSIGGSGDGGGGPPNGTSDGESTILADFASIAEFFTADQPEDSDAIQIFQTRADIKLTVKPYFLLSV